MSIGNCKNHSTSHLAIASLFLQKQPKHPHYFSVFFTKCALTFSRFIDWSWQVAQSTGFNVLWSSGCFTVTSMWQLMQVLVLCAEAASCALSTNNETCCPAALVLERFLSSWQSRQKLFFNAGDPEAVAPANTAANAPTNQANLTLMLRSGSPKQGRVHLSSWQELRIYCPAPFYGPPVWQSLHL